MTKKEIELYYKIAQEAHTMGRLYERTLSSVNPAVEFTRVSEMVSRMLDDVREEKTNAR